MGSKPLRQRRGTALGCRGEDPIEGEDAKESRPGGFAMPAAGGIGAGDVLVAEHLHRFIFGERGAAALLFQIDVFAVFGAFKDHSIG